MKFTSKVLILNVAERSFVNKKGETINYIKCVLVDESGEILSTTCPQAIFDSLEGRSKVEGVATFEVSPDFSQKPRLSLISFEEEN